MMLDPQGVVFKNGKPSGPLVATGPPSAPLLIFCALEQVVKDTPIQSFLFLLQGGGEGQNISKCTIVNYSSRHCQNRTDSQKCLFVRHNYTLRIK